MEQYFALFRCHIAAPLKQIGESCETLASWNASFCEVFDQLRESRGRPWESVFFGTTRSLLTSLFPLLSCLLSSLSFFISRSRLTICPPGLPALAGVSADFLRGGEFENYKF